MLKQIREIFGKNHALLILSAITLSGLPGSIAFADTPAVPAGSGAPAGAASAAPGFGSMILPFAAMFAVVYFLMIRPQQKKMKEQQQMLSQLKQGDEVITTSGILGRITMLTDKIVTVEIADKVRVRMLRSQISQVMKGQQEGGAA